jgi:hypothetical protein
MIIDSIVFRTEPEIPLNIIFIPFCPVKGLFCGRFLIIVNRADIIN